MTFWLSRGLTALAFMAVLSSPGMAEQRTTTPDQGLLGTSVGNGNAEALLPDTLTLPAALDFAREHNPEVRVMRAGLAVARAESTFAGIGQFNPELEAQVSRG